MPNKENSATALLDLAFRLAQSHIQNGNKAGADSLLAFITEAENNILLPQTAIEPEEIEEILNDYHVENESECILFPDLKDALIGYVERFGMPRLALYDYDRCIGVRVDGGMTQEEAEEFHEFNTAGAWMGEGTPFFAKILR